MVFFIGNVIGGLNTRRGTIVDSEVRDDEFTAVAEVALNDMFGYSSQLRGQTQGKGEFSMEYKVSRAAFITAIFSLVDHLDLLAVTRAGITTAPEGTRRSLQEDSASEKINV